MFQYRANHEQKKISTNELREMGTLIVDDAK